MEKFTINLYAAPGDVFTPLHKALGMHLVHMVGHEEVEVLVDTIDVSGPEDLFAGFERLAEQSSIEADRDGVRVVAFSAYRTAEEDKDDAKGIFSGCDPTKCSVVEFTSNSMEVLASEAARNVMRNSGFWPEIYGAPDAEPSFEVFEDDVTEAAIVH